VAREISLKAPVLQTGASLNLAKEFFFSFEKPPANNIGRVLCIV